MSRAKQSWNALIDSSLLMMDPVDTAAGPHLPAPETLLRKRLQQA
jgi:hypothetical protein